MSKKIKLQPVMMITPTKEGTHAPAPPKLITPKEISEETFINEYADTAEKMNVSFDPDGASNPQSVTSYYRQPSPMTGRFIVSDNSACTDNS